MATIKNNGQEVILLCNMGYDYDGKKIKPVAKSVIVPDNVISAVWLSKQAEIFENEVKARQAMSYKRGWGCNRQWSYQQANRYRYKDCKYKIGQPLL